ncbi:MAG: hypothetical protein ABI867_27315 [Kofleriaceae bacterium]
MIERLARVPDVVVPVTPKVEAAIAETVAYLGSDAAVASIERDPYWPKWDSPWWHMLLLWELGEARRIPERSVRAMIDAMNALPVKIFPLRESELPPGTSPHFHISCHCAMGSLIQILAACGVDSYREMPWATPWFPRYQMADGGLNCDSDAYLVEGETPSSMVGTVPALEAVLLGPWTPEYLAFADRAAAFLIERRVMLGSQSTHNAEERTREPVWKQLCFPRLYLYDVLRGLAALVRYAEVREQVIPRAAIEPVIEYLLAEFPDGVVRAGRRSFEGIPTRAPGVEGRQPASVFALLEATSTVGEASPWLTRQWAGVRTSVLQLAGSARIAG